MNEEAPVHIEDDDPPIKTHPASKEYRENYDRVFGEEPRVTCGENVVETDPSVGPDTFTVTITANPPTEPCEVCGVPAGAWCLEGCTECPRPK